MSRDMQAHKCVWVCAHTRSAAVAGSASVSSNSGAPSCSVGEDLHWEGSPTGPLKLLTLMLTCSQKFVGQGPKQLQFYWNLFIETQLYLFLETFKNNNTLGIIQQPIKHEIIKPFSVMQHCLVLWHHNLVKGSGHASSSNKIKNHGLCWH